MLTRKDFQSMLFRRRISGDDPEFLQYAIAESLYRIRDYESRRSLTDYEKKKLEKLKEALEIWMKEFMNR